MGSASLSLAPLSAAFLGRGAKFGPLLLGAIGAAQLSECQGTFAGDIMSLSALRLIEPQQQLFFDPLGDIAKGTYVPALFNGN